KHYDYSTDKQWSKERFHHPYWLKPGSPSTLGGALDNMEFKLSLWLCTNYDFSEYEEWKLLHGKGSIKDISENGPLKQQSGQEDIILDQRLGDKKPDEIAAQSKQIEPWFDHLKKFVDDGAAMFKLDGADQVTFKITPDRKWANGMDD